MAVYSFFTFNICMRMFSLNCHIGHLYA